MKLKFVQYKLLQILNFLFIIIFLKCESRYYFISKTNFQKTEKLKSNKKFKILGFNSFRRMSIKNFINLNRKLQSYLIENHKFKNFNYNLNYIQDVDITKENLILGERLYEFETNEIDLNTNNENIIQFLKFYFENQDETNIKEIGKLFTIEKDKLYLKKFDTDYYIIGFIRLPEYKLSSRSFPVYYLSLIPYILTLTIFPNFGEDIYSLEVYIYDKNFNQVKKFNYEENYFFFRSFLLDLFEKEPFELSKLYEKKIIKVNEDLKNFLKEVEYK